jgi:hypothetical protein
MISSLTHLAINGLHCHSLPHLKNEWQWNVNDFGHYVMNHPAGCAVTANHNQTISRLSIEQRWWQHFYYILKMIVNRVSTTFGHAFWKMHGLCGEVTS